MSRRIVAGDLPGGRAIALEIEQKLRQTPLVSDAVVYGDRQPYLVALVTLDGDAAARLVAGIGIPADPATMPHDDRVRAEIQAAVDAVNAHFARIEQIKRFAILDRALSNPRASSRRQ